jgi:zinc transport system substrate-binding protein
MVRLLAFSLVALFMPGCGDSGPADTVSGEKSVYIVAVNAPLVYFARRLLDGQVEVVMPAPADTDPAQWRPTAEDIVQLQGAELVLLNGAGYSSWLKHVSLSSGRTVLSGEAARGRWIALDDQVTHSHGPEGEHAHRGYAFTTWMDMKLARVQVQAVSEALQSRFPALAEAIIERRGGLLADLDALDKAFEEAVAPLRSRQVIYSHPVYQYFEARYQLPGLSLHWEPDVMPEDGQWRKLEAALQGNALFVWEGTPEAAIAARLNALGASQVTLDPGANTRGDWLQLQRENVKALQSLGGMLKPQT